MKNEHLGKLGILPSIHGGSKPIMLDKISPHNHQSPIFGLVGVKKTFKIEEIVNKLIDDGNKIIAL